MKCNDCIHYNSISDTEGRCLKMTYSGIIDIVDADSKVCPECVSKDGTYHNGTEHCPRCGKAVSEWGLCDECENVYLTHESVGNALDALDSWESVSK